jgi:hypothetical protein
MITEKIAAATEAQAVATTFALEGGNGHTKTEATARRQRGRFQGWTRAAATCLARLPLRILHRVIFASTFGDAKISLRTLP